MGKISCLIVDDEPLALDILENYIQRVPNLDLQQRCNNALEAYDYLQQHEVDLLFLDIHMPELTGIDLLKSLSNRPAVIFTTAYPNYAMEGYELDVLDYLLKPIAFDRFLKAVGKANKVLLREAEGYSSSEASGSEANSPEEEYIFVKSDLKLVKVRYDDILFIEGMKDYVKIQLPGQRIVTHQTMKGMESALPADRFMRIHRSYIVALDKIESLDSNLIEVGEHRISIGANYRESLQAHIAKYNLGRR